MEDNNTFRLNQSKVNLYKSLSMDTEMGKALWDVSEQSSQQQKQNTWQKEKCTTSKTASTHHKKIK